MKNGLSASVVLAWSACRGPLVSQGHLECLCSGNAAASTAAADAVAATASATATTLGSVPASRPVWEQRTEAGAGSELNGDASLSVQVSSFSGYGRSGTDGGGLSGRGGASGLGRGRWWQWGLLQRRREGLGCSLVS